MKKLDAELKKYIKEQNNYEIFRLLFEFYDDIDIKHVIYYYIKTLNYSDLCTLITLVDIDYLDYIFEKIVSTKNKEFIFYILKNGTINSIISGTKYEKILEKELN